MIYFLTRAILAVLAGVSVALASMTGDMLAVLCTAALGAVALAGVTLDRVR